MTDDSVREISLMLTDAIGGRTPWILLWATDGKDHDKDGDGIMSNVPRDDLPEMLCVYLLKTLRHELGADDTLMVGH